jgi:hypothetical protein
VGRDGVMIGGIGEVSRGWQDCRGGSDIEIGGGVGRDG